GRGRIPSPVLSRPPSRCRAGGPSPRGSRGSRPPPSPDPPVAMPCASSVFLRVPVGDPATRIYRERARRTPGHTRRVRRGRRSSEDIGEFGAQRGLGLRAGEPLDGLSLGEQQQRRDGGDLVFG